MVVVDGGALFASDRDRPRKGGDICMDAVPTSGNLLLVH
jgi:hypothetical protein